ncbi:sulfatase-like hydrolase/transferase [Haloarcula sp. S1CR25-12]|uniref:Sulfatase-like hydrolase/transferase n=1 Tax=Haloarcula saliterrae TaxID=2950534 RepID=A0ABU2FGR3_9EURY|nr:sulfatase-like hydrolase/transferase [Haloarcula sp. S1CR25-12]
MQTHFGPLYYRYLSRQADKKHQNEVTASPTAGPDAPDHVVVLVIDALRPDFAPDLLQLDFTRAVAPGTWTFPSVTSMQTGLPPHEHGAVAHTHPDDESFAIPKQYGGTETLPAVLEAAGYETYLGSAFITPYLALNGWYQSHRVYGDAPAETVLSDYRSWRRNRELSYAYLQLGDLHAPIEPPEEYVRNRDVDTSLEGLAELDKYTEDYSAAPPQWREQRLRLYQAALDYVEDTLESHLSEILDDTLVVVVGDHGEAMWENHELDKQFADSRPNYGVGHGGTPLDEIARVPLAVHHPSRDGPTFAGLPNGRDIPRTICDGVGITDPTFDGVSWFEGIPSDRSTVCEATRYGTERKAVYQGNEKVIRSQTRDITLGATVKDAGGETFDTLSEETMERLVAQLPDSWDDMDIEGEASAMVQDQLEALGYR